MLLIPDQVFMSSRILLLLLVVFCGIATQTWATTYDLPDENNVLIGKVQVVHSKYEDTLLDIARRHDIGFEEIVAVNPGVNVWLPGEGTRIVIPTQYILPPVPRKGIVINIPEMRLYYYPDTKDNSRAQVITYPISIGRMKWSTPLAVTTITKKTIDPVWIPPESIREEYEQAGNPLPAAISPGPYNPLGKYALALGIPGYLIHGTNRAYGIGLQSTHGCIRLYPEDIEVLFNSVRVGTQVRIINQPYKSGWSNGMLYLEAHPRFDTDKDNAEDSFTPAIREIVAAVPETLSQEVDWETVRASLLRSNGIPIPVTSTQPADLKFPAEK